MEMILNLIISQLQYVRVTFDSNGHMSSMRNTESNIEVPLQQNFFYYLAHGGECTSDTTKQPSGAYIFRPADGNNLVKMNLTKWQGVYKVSLDTLMGSTFSFVFF